MEKRPLRIPLRVVFYKEDGDWVAHCLEFDLVGHGPSIKKSLQLLFEAIVIQIEQSVKCDNPKNLFMPADGEYFRMFAEGKDIAEAQLQLGPIDSIVIERTDFREYHKRGRRKDTELVPA